MFIHPLISGTEDLFIPSDESIALSTKGEELSIHPLFSGTEDLFISSTYRRERPHPSASEHKGLMHGYRQKREEISLSLSLSISLNRQDESIAFSMKEGRDSLLSF